MFTLGNQRRQNLEGKQYFVSDLALQTQSCGKIRMRREWGSVDIQVLNKIMY